MSMRMKVAGSTWIRCHLLRKKIRRRRLHPKPKARLKRLSQFMAKPGLIYPD